jgi:acyl-CoA thioesterase FadM
MARFNHTKRLKKGDRVLVHLRDGYVGKATVVKHSRITYIPDQDCFVGALHVVYDDKVRRMRTIDDWLATPLSALELLAEI